MGVTGTLLIACAAFLVGFPAGARFEELNLRWRERRLANARRALVRTDGGAYVLGEFESMSDRPRRDWGRERDVVAGLGEGLGEGEAVELPVRESYLPPRQPAA
ncbi:hypothetical protein [Pseudonocardia acaciae]|uniref:hypothetical protein n=1 Tax=Pseudonocardia acaciae TaxID=551276 RepID=UPI00048CD79F|nr:hypothetical protein [Pseudonocardia acaciae]